MRGSQRIQRFGELESFRSKYLEPQKRPEYQLCYTQGHYKHLAANRTIKQNHYNPIPTKAEKYLNGILTEYPARKTIISTPVAVERS